MEVEEGSAPASKVISPAENLRQQFVELVELLRGHQWEEASRLVNSNEQLLLHLDSTNRHAAHWAASVGYQPLIERSVERDEQLVEAVDDSGWTILMIAASAGHIECVRFLLSRSNTDVNHRNLNGQTPLHYACSKNHLAIARMLVENGAELDVQDKFGASPLHRAASQGHENIVNFLVGRREQRHIDISDQDGNTPLHLACDEGHGSVALFLVRSGANPQRKNREGETALDLTKGDMELRRKLQQAFQLRQHNNHN